MTFNWLEYFHLAQELAGELDITSNQESKQRSAISRAYYAAYHYACFFLGAFVPLSHTSADHKTVCDFLAMHANRSLRKAGLDLDRLRDNRKKADYRDDISKLGDITRQSLKLAEDIITIINAQPSCK
jgi:uncharacterized protein (UPF0332 family)